MAVTHPDFWAPFEHCHLGGQKIVTASRTELAQAMVDDCLAAREIKTKPRLVFDLNGHGLSLYASDENYQTAMDMADIIHADGGFLVSLSRILTQTPIAERSATTDMFHDCAKAAAKNSLSFYILGGTETVNAECARRLKVLYPDMNIIGRRNGFFSIDEEANVIEEINTLKPDVLWVGLGKPKEQVFSVQWRDHLTCGWLVTCGGCYNYVTGDYPRAPLWMQRANIEWLYRMATNRKLVRRYLTTNLHALWLVLRRGDKA
ncbi:WecB/TagA/CpsF family glycosyltransferase [Thalassospira xianhensis]|uniref:WecB/TagA/CpsF family glycosyltransferase n=1 Tax=Thalassospira xianhensis TaxID=478503 RepID=UPI000DEDD8A4|nr:WecB/TagA/CpsF family glycosyltransferase [Thalassospira xianhensis]